MKTICNKCKEEISNLEYDESTYGHEWGTCNFDGEDSEMEDSETTDYDNFTTTCPECQEEIDSSDVMVLDDDDNEICSWEKFDNEYYQKTGKYREISSHNSIIKLNLF